jgi:hypothetical protein
MAKERGTFGEKQSVRLRKMKTLLGVYVCVMGYLEEEKGLGGKERWDESQENTQDKYPQRNS